MKHRSSLNYATQYASQKRGWGLGLEEFLFVAAETSRGTFVPATIGTQGSSVSAATPSLDISAATVPATLNVNVDGEGVTLVSLAAVVGLTTGPLIADALETEINNDLATAGRSGRVWVEFDAGLYKIRSQKAGADSTVVITNGTTNNIADDLKLGVPNAGVETVGTNGAGYLITTKAGLRYSQARENSRHKVGRQAINTIVKKRMTEGDLEMYVNLATGGSAAIDTALSVVLEMLFGRKRVSGGEIIFDSAQPQSSYFSVYQGTNISGMTVVGGYAKSLTLTISGDGEPTMAIPLKGGDAKISSIAKLDLAIAAAVGFTAVTGDGENLEVGARVMVVSPDGQTVVAGADGTLSIVTLAGDIGTLSAPVTVADEGFVVPWAPQYLGGGALVAIDNPCTSLEGEILVDGAIVEEFNGAEFSFDPSFEDLDDIYGQPGNYGYIAGGRQVIGCKLDLRISAEQYKRILSSKAKKKVPVEIRIKNGARSLIISMPRVDFDVPSVEFPDEGSVPVSLEGKALATEAGAYDAFTFRYT